MQRPCIKSVYPPFPVGDGMIRIGGVDYGMAAEISDDDQGHMWQLLSLLDGTRTTKEIIDEMQKHDPSLLADDVENTITALIDNGYLEDAVHQPPPEVFADREVERYRRNLEFFSYFHLPPWNSYDL